MMIYVLIKLPTVAELFLPLSSSLPGYILCLREAVTHGWVEGVQDQGLCGPHCLLSH